MVNILFIAALSGSLAAAASGGDVPRGCSRSPAPGTKSAALGTAAPGTAALKVRHCGTDNKFLIFSIFNVFFYFCQCGVGWFTVCYAKIILKLCNFIKIIGLKQF